MGAQTTTLVVDGDRTARLRLADILSHQGCAVLTAADVGSASIEIEQRAIDVLFTEVSLADGEGISLICAARRRWPTSQAVVVAAHPSVETSIEALRHRVADFVLKPISEVKIVSALERARASCQRQVAIEETFDKLDHPLEGPARLLHASHDVPVRLGVLGGNLRDWKQRLVREAVNQCQGNKAAAAHALGISRRTLYRILQSPSSDPEQSAPAS